MALVNKTFSDIITFTRASTATYFNSAGVLTSAATNAPRFDYDPSTLAAQGLLIEEARTNLVLQSKDFATTWGQSGSPTVSTNTTVAPDNTTTGDTIGSTTTASYVFQNITFTGDGTKAFSIFIKQGTSTVNRLFVRDITAGLNRGQTDVTWTVGVPSVVVANGSLLSLTQLSNGWYRVQVAVDSVVAANSNQLRIQPDTAAGTGTVILWGAQLENGAFPTSYIPTTTTALTRAADVASVNTLSPWYNAATGTVYAEFDLYAFTAGQSYRFAFSDGTTSNQLRARLAPSGTTQARHEVVNSGVSTTLGSPATINLALTKEAFAYATNDYAGVVNNGTPSTSATLTVPSVNVLQLGATVGGATGILNGHLRRIVYYPRRLSNAELQSITS